MSGSDLRAAAEALCDEVGRVFGGCLTAPIGIVKYAAALRARLAEPSAPAPAPSEPCTVHEEVLDGALVRATYTGTRPEDDYGTLANWRAHHLADAALARLGASRG